MSYERTSTLGKIGYVVLGGIIGTAISWGVASKKMNSMEAAYQAMIDGKKAEMSEEMKGYNSKMSDPNFLLSRYNAEIKAEGLKPRDGCADPASIDLKLDANNQGACLVMSDLKSKTQNPVHRSEEGKLYAGNNVTGAIEDVKNKAGNFIDDLFH